MSSLPKCRRVKRPTTLAKRSQLAKKNIYKKRSYKPLYEKLKGNNNALAKALSQEKQECQYLFSQNLALTSEVQELGIACNKRDDIISGVLKNAKETLELLIKMSNHVANTIASCQQVVTTTRFTPRKSTTADERRESARRLSGKSPARGVVQPMVSGHTITKPTINLSRLNIQREYRIQNPPNLSDIDEVLTTPEQSPSTVSSATPVRLPIARPLNYGARRVDRVPERLPRSIRTSDESERRSSVRGSRNSGRHSVRRSPPNSNETAEVEDDERLRSPRVALQDVSRLLQNAQSVNIRTFLETTSDMNLAPPQQTEDANNSDNTPIADSEDQETLSETSRGEYETTSPSSPIEVKKRKEKISAPNENEDPLEGPSWLLNASEVATSRDDTVTTTVTDSLVNKTRENGKNNKNVVNNENRKMTRREDDDDDDEQTVNLATRWANHGSNFYRNFNDRDDRTDTNLPCFVTRKRGSHCDDTDDFTLMWRGPTATNYNFDINDLELPVLEDPIVPALEIRAPEPDPTTNIQIITTQNFGDLTSVCRLMNVEDTIRDSTRLTVPLLPVNSMRMSVVEQDERSDEDDSVPARKQKKPHAKRVYVPDSPTDSDWTPSPKRKNIKEKRKQRAKDPSSAKVVLQKLKDEHVTKRSSSPEARQSQENVNNQQRSTVSIYREPSSDSEVSSNASSNKFTSSAEVRGRPRRQKAPKNLQEPSLGKKLRRN